jgi:hypothetical protein
MLKYLFEHNPSCGRLLEAALRDRVATLTILASHADERGIAAIRRDKRGFGGIDIKAATIIGDNRRVFDPLSVALADGARLVAFQEFCEELGTRLNPGNPLGWANAQWCVVLDYSVPNGTLPILWASSAGVDWHPLFGRSRKPVGRLNKERSKTVHPPA